MANNDIRNIRVLAFLDAYERQECLWNPSLDSYKNKADRDRAYLQIIRELDIPSLTVHDVKLKVKGIRTTYTKELRCLNRYKEHGKTYKPKLFWFNRANSFLKSVCVSRHRKPYFLKEEDTSNQIEYKDCPADYISETGSTGENTEHEANDALVDIEEPNEEDTTAEHKTTTIQLNQVEAYDYVEQTDTQMDYHEEKMPSEQAIIESTRVEDPPSANKPQPNFIWKDDEFDMFCRSVAAQLRSIPDSYSRSVAKLKIQQIIFEAETGHYKNIPCITIPVAHP